MLKILITGASGFVGQNLTNYFKLKDYPLLNISRSKGMDYNLLTTDYLNNNNINVIIHLAGKAHDINKKNNNLVDYYDTNTRLTSQIFDNFLSSEARIFVFLSSVKAATDSLKKKLSEDFSPNPTTHYGKSKLLAERYILSKNISKEKKVFILRPCMIHGPGNKGNLNLLYKIVAKGIPWPLGAFNNKRSYCSIDNLCFIINELIYNETIPSGIYNIADDESLSTNELIMLISQIKDKKINIWKVPVKIVKLFSKLGDIFNFPLNSERLNKLTETYLVSNNKIKNAINKPLPLSAKEGLEKTLNSFNSNVY